MMSEHEMCAILSHYGAFCYCMGRRDYEPSADLLEIRPGFSSST